MRNAYFGNYMSVLLRDPLLQIRAVILLLYFRQFSFLPLRSFQAS